MHEGHEDDRAPIGNGSGAHHAPVPFEYDESLRLDLAFHGIKNLIERADDVGRRETVLAQRLTELEIDRRVLFHQVSKLRDRIKAQQEEIARLAEQGTKDRDFVRGLRDGVLQRINQLTPHQ